MKQCKYISKVIFYTLCILLSGKSGAAQSSTFNIKTINGNTVFAHNQTPENIVSVYSGVTATFQWQKSITAVNGFTDISGSTQSAFTFNAPLDQTTWFRRKAIISGTTVYSNVLKIELASVNWENYNYVREHEVLIAGMSDWKVIDELAIGDKLQTTNYMDGLGRVVEKVSRETGTPVNPNNLWADVVQFSKYDALGRQAKGYLPYTTTTSSGRFKTTTVTEQPQYYTSVYNETAAFSNPTFDNSPLNRVVNVKQPGTSWAAGNGNSASYEVNDQLDNVQIFTIGYNTSDRPISVGVYPANSLFKTRSIDEYGKQVIEYTNKSGQLILRKVQIDELPLADYPGWICVYSVYDHFGLLRYHIQPEAVMWLYNNNWSFSGTEGEEILKEMCFKYEYDEKGRNILKRAPGAEELYLIYDKRDRLVFMQDGNQRAKSPAEWTAKLYDQLDRDVITTLYHTNKTVAQLQADIDNAVTITSVTINNPSGLQVTLIIDARVLSITAYRAQNSIEFIAGFESGVNDEFIAETDPSAVTQPITVTTAIYHNPITESDLNNPAVTTILKYLFYDNYDYPTVKSFNLNFENGLAYTTSDPIESTERTTSMLTGSMVRVLGSNTFLSTTLYYDDKGRTIQTIEDNIKNGKDVTTEQFAFDNRLLSTHTLHTTANTGYGNFSVITKNIFDKIGRVVDIEKRYGGNSFKSVAIYSFDDLGRLKEKRLAPGYTGTGHTEIEKLTYSYNIQNQLTGINKDYALKTPGNYNKWGNFFGLYLGYDNSDGVFANQLLTGQVTGALWNTQGDDAQRKYDFKYDNAGRLTNAIFKEKKTPADIWTSSSMDFSVTGHNEKIEYDLNGNLLSMLQKGVVPGNLAPVTVDDMRYVYVSLSNKLAKVTDMGNLAGNNGKLGDFKDGNNGTLDDYVYDENGNLVIDLNKSIKDLGGQTAANGIKYNFLDKPEEIRISGKGVVKIVYDAIGNKLQKSFTAEGSSNTVTTSFINQFIYQEDHLQYINFEEGRIRVLQTVSENNGFDMLTIDGSMDLPNGKRGVYDFFILDYQSNVRMILTEETHIGSNTCTMETQRAPNEEPVFGQVDINGSPTTANEVAARFPVASIPGQSLPNSGWTNPDIANYVSRNGNLASSKVGPNTLLKVMAGDRLSAQSLYYYKDPVTNHNSGNEILSNIITTLTNVISGSTSTNPNIKDAASNITNNLNGSSFSNATSPDANNPVGNTPKAYLTILFFDERFKFVEEGNISDRVRHAGDNIDLLQLINIKAPKNGYVFIYVSNESDEHVYFDNLQVTHERGRIVEENHYYSYGLKIAAISSKKLGDVNEGRLTNQYQFQGEYSEFDDETGWNEFPLRDYDPQIGRFMQTDPYDQFPSPYTGMGNDPVNLTDPTGGLSINFGTISTLGRIGVAAAGAVAGFVIDKSTGGNGWTGAIIGGGVALGATFIPPFDIGAVAGTIGKAAPVAVQVANIYATFANLTIVDDWKPFFKSDLITYTVAKGIDPTENNLGEQFENIVEQTLKSSFPVQTKLMNFRRPARVWTEGTGRNTKPDFVSDDFYDEACWFCPAKRKNVFEGSGYEVKQNSGRGIYLSSNNWQIRGHIDNLAAKHAADILSEKYNPSLTLLTTYDVNWSPSVTRYAGTRGVQYTHRRAMYKLVNGKYYFKFVGFGTSSW